MGKKLPIQVGLHSIYLKKQTNLDYTKPLYHFSITFSGQNKSGSIYHNVFNV